MGICRLLGAGQTFFVILSDSSQVVGIVKQPTGFLMALRELQFDFDEKPLPEAILKWLKAARARIELYWDHFKEKPVAPVCRVRV